MGVLRFAGAFWLIFASLGLRAPLPLPQFLQLLQALPELALGTAALQGLPVLVGGLSVWRWLQPERVDRDGPLAVATRAAAVLGIITQLLPLPMPVLDTIVAELALRLSLAIALALTLDSGLQPRPQRVATIASSGVGTRPSSRT